MISVCGVIEVVGVLLSLLFFGLKAGAGCGFSSHSTKTAWYIGLPYLAAGIVFSFIAPALSDRLDSLLNLTLLLHSMLAVLLILSGVYTAKSWWGGCDVSKKTFLVLSVPCPVCLTATLLACTILIEALHLNAALVGIGVGLFLLFAIVFFTHIVKQFHPSPRGLGELMMVVGMFYLIGALIMPAYMNLKDIPTVTASFSNEMLFPLLAMAAVAAFGFVFKRFREGASR